ncbi:MAG: hypothetical protein HON76_19575 [Candidatus Scalindua sp.]|nr:hypothetical protein [Candidatus Scalindua sp.]MBT5304250.1 hypothetical protein [Candidatus Scalindua sp.]MBT6049057.1 hypothetical protein [Candidatus Scalindua sp.]MBT6226001.1 hypothetical protein [Candidatus Scalindua sp.]MBT6564720.1 hypothetical protein [Candidatus Scalindua sp.]
MLVLARRQGESLKIGNKLGSDQAKLLV